MMEATTIFSENTVRWPTEEKRKVVALISSQLYIPISETKSRTESNGRLSNVECIHITQELSNLKLEVGLWVSADDVSLKEERLHGLQLPGAGVVNVGGHQEVVGGHRLNRGAGGQGLLGHPDVLGLRWKTFCLELFRFRAHRESHLVIVISNDHPG